MDETSPLAIAASLPFIKLTGALLIGILIGWEREHRENIPGTRLLPLVAVGATLFTFYARPTESGELLNPQLAGGIVTGVGFLGAGMIARQYGTLTGVTTAATIWVTAALGIGLGLGLYVQVSLVTGAVLLILWIFPHFSRASNYNLYYEIIAPYDQVRYDLLHSHFAEHKVKILRHSLSRNNDQMTCVWFTNGDPQRHQQLGWIFMNDKEITNFITRLN